jgi:phage terminase large subunit
MSGEQRIRRVPLQTPYKYRPFIDPTHPQFNCRFKGAYGGRGTGKSHTIAELLLTVAVHHGPRIVCARQYQNSIAESVKALLENKIDLYKLPNFTIRNTEIVHRKSGARFTFHGLQINPESIKSLEGADILAIEEAANVTETSTDKLFPTIRRPNSQIWSVWNPEEPTDPIDKLHRGKDKHPDSVAIHVTQADNMHWSLSPLANEAAILKIRDPLKWAWIYGGQYRSMSDARVFKHVTKGRRETTLKDRPRFGLDFGFANDPNALIKFYLLDKGTTLYIAAAQRLTGLPTASIPAWLRLIGESDRYAIVCDSARPETIDHLQRNGFDRATGAKKGAGSIEAGISYLQGLNIVVDPLCEDVYDELIAYKYQVNRKTNEVLPVLQNGDDHYIDALRYGSEDDRNGVGTGQVMTIKMR